jgi:P27 family predicted phage terminase small subunit
MTLTAIATKKRLATIEHLSADMQQFYRKVARKYALSDHHRRLLVCSCEAHDRMTAARDLLATTGLVLVNRHGETVAHPAVAIERDSRTAFARMLRELGLADDVSDAMRPPRLAGRYAGRA